MISKDILNIKKFISKPLLKISYKHYFNLSILLMLIIITFGWLVFSRLRPRFELKESQLMQQIVSLKSEIKILQKENADLQLVIKPEKPYPTDALNDSDDINLPVVVYSRPGFLNNTTSGRAEKKILEKKLVRPYIDYHNEDGIDLVALLITVPKNILEPYGVKGILKDGGLNGENFGSREGEYDYWRPLCMGGCDYSDEFKKKYPEIVEPN